MNYKIILPCVLLLSAILFFTFRRVDNTSIKIVNSNNLDNISEAPEWLKVVVDEALPDEGLNVWIPAGNFQLSPLVRVPRFLRSFTDAELASNPALKKFQIEPMSVAANLQLSGVRNEQISAQLGLAARQELNNVQVKTSSLKSREGLVIEADQIEIRYVQYVPVQRSRSEYIWSAKYEDVAGNEVSGFMSPDVVGDPLVELEYVDVPAYRAQAIWFTFKIPKNAVPGRYKGTINLFCNEFSKETYNLEIEVLDKSIPDPADYEFFLDMWLNPNSIAFNHQVEPWSEDHWTLLVKYMKDLASRGGKAITATITQEPWRKPWLHDSQKPQTLLGFESLVKWKMKENKTWEFDFSLFDRYVQTSMEAGLKERINVYSLTSFNGQERIEYEDQMSGEVKEQVFSSIEDAEYKSAWSAFLKSFSTHLKEMEWLDKTYLCFDEKPYETMQEIKHFIEENAPEFKERIAISGHPESTDFADGFLSISYEFFPGQNLDSQNTLPVIEERNKNDRLTTFYLCGQPAHPNTLTFSPAIESQMIPWLALKYNVAGYLRWAYCSWPEDPFNNPVHNYIQGDEYIVYPGEDGPVSSIRWELMKEGVEQYELFRVLKLKGQIDESRLNKVIELATRNLDGRVKNIEDFDLVRNILFDENPKDQAKTVKTNLHPPSD